MNWKLTQAQADEIRTACATGQRQKDIAAEFGITQSMVSKIKRGDWRAADPDCGSCGVAFTREHPRDVYCSRRCYLDAWNARRKAAYRNAHPVFVVACAQCGQDFEQRQEGQAYCSHRCCSNAGSRVANIRRKHAAEAAEPVSRTYIIARDKSICHLCGKKCRPDEIELDHLVPLALGGEHSKENLRVSHAWCNRSKKTRAMNEQLLLLG